MKKLLLVMCLALFSFGTAAAGDGSGSGLVTDASQSPSVPAQAGGPGSSASIPSPIVTPAPTQNTNGSGSATAPVVTIDPSKPVQSATDAWAALKQYGYVWGGTLVLFGIGTIIIKKNDDTHWLSTDHFLPIGVGLLGVLGAAINARFAGGSWTTVFAALMGAVTLVLQKPTPGKSST